MDFKKVRPRMISITEHEIIESISVRSAFGETVFDVSPHEFDL